MVKGGRTQCARPDVGGGLPQRNTTALRMITSFIIPYWDWQARNRFWGHLSEMPVYRASEATTIRKHLPTYRYKPEWVSALAIYHSLRESLESQLQRSIARQAGGAQTQSAFLRPLLPAPQPWRIALLRRLRYALSSSELMSQGSEIRNPEIHT